MEKNHLKLNQKLKDFDSRKKPILLLSIICISGLMVRFHYVPYGLPFTLDAFSGYFLYALDISVLGHLPNYSPAQSGWSEFISLFFMSLHSDNLIDYIDLQRTVSVVLSGITVIPVYFICKKFFNSYYSLIGATIFALEPRIIINSTLGISEPLYILSITLGILFFLNLNKKVIYLSFGFFAWATIIRPEGQFWFVAFSIIYFLRFRKKRKDLIMYLICLSVFLLVLSPIVIHRIECCGEDAIVGRIIIELSNYDKVEELNNQDQINSYGPNWINGIKLFGWSVIPIFIIFTSIGLVPIFKQLKYPNYLLVLVPAILAIPIMYSVSIAPDTRYVYPLFSIFCVISLFGIKWIVDNFYNKKLVLSLIVIAIIIGSMAFLEIKKIEYGDEDEVYQVTKFVVDNAEGINWNTKIEKYILAAEMANDWPVKYTPGKERLPDVKQFILNEAETLDEFIIKHREQKLTHIIVDEYSKSTLSEVYHHEEKFPYLEKIYESKEHGYDYDMKLYKINYDSFVKHTLSIN